MMSHSAAAAMGDNDDQGWAVADNERVSLPSEVIEVEVEEPDQSCASAKLNGEVDGGHPVGCVDKTR